ncbi:hypothetical protein [Actinomadura coerulea]|uniref:hypothetical protein n=1 Tax=Actinomadura coerulea TaxID=46159 RepID=UPI003439698F
MTILSFFSSSVGVAAATGLVPLQASAWISVPGTLFFLAFVYLRHGVNRVWTAAEKVAYRRIALGNLLVNIGWPFAGLTVGIGTAAAIMAVGPVSVGLWDDIKFRRTKMLLLRAGVMAGVLLVTEPWDGATFSGWQAILGVLGAAGGAWHFWNLLKCLDVFGKNDAKRQDQAMLVSNLIAAPIILCVAVTVSLILGQSWVSGDVNFGSVASVVMRGAFAALFVFVFSILLTNRAKGYLQPSTQGVMFAFSPIVGGIVGVVGGHFGWIPGNQGISVVSGAGIVVVSFFAYRVAREQAAQEKAVVEAGSSVDAREGDALGGQPPVPPVLPVEPKDNPWARPAGGLPPEPAWVTAQRVPAREFSVAITGTAMLTAAGVQFPDGSGFNCRVGNLSVRIESVGGGTHSDGSFTGSWALGISVVIDDGTEVSIPSTGAFRVDLNDGTVYLESGVTIRPGGVRAAE